MGKNGTWWSRDIAPENAQRRAGGRRHYNAWRRDMALLRQVRIEVRLLELGYYALQRGVQRQLAEELGVSEATISRDIRAIHRRGEFAIGGVPFHVRFRYTHPHLRGL